MWVIDHAEQQYLFICGDARNLRLNRTIMSVPIYCLNMRT